jgi:hypothetical protein
MSKLSVPQEKNTIVKNAWVFMIYVIAKSVLFDAKFRDKQMANVSTYQLKPSGPSEPSATNVGCGSDNKNGDGKPTTTASTSTLANCSADIINTTTIATDTNNAIYRLGHTATNTI